MSKWVNNIPKKFREMLTSNDDVTEELIDMVINQLREMYKFKYADELIDSIDETREHFEFLKDLINGAISEDDWGDYEFNGNFQEWFDDYLHEFWDICDSYVGKKHNMKFCFVSL